MKTSIFALALALLAVPMFTNASAQEEAPAATEDSTNTQQVEQGDQEADNTAQEAEEAVDEIQIAAPPNRALQFTMTNIDGDDVDLTRYQGKVVVVVNTASRCGLTPQYEQLQELYSNYGDQGVVVLGFPCNQFLAQEPGSEAEIKEFCQKNYGVSFDMFSKIDVNGGNRSELYEYLCSLELAPAGAGDISWNFE
ncbi:MAG: glutathione peroxidase, partial [Planctomycetota bacterium]